MNKYQRIRLNSGQTQSDKHIKFKLEQDVETLEIMSLEIDTKEAYRDFNSDYGVLVGRVLANGNVGVPNAKISIFIPLDEEDENNGEIVSVYPYKKTSDKNNMGKRYNLLPRVSRINPNTESPEPKQPFGSFPIKEEIIANSTLLEVYQKYYKYSTVTNESGDYMIFGVPIGTQTVHMSCDITDIGKNSMTPASMINIGYDEKLFTDNNSKVKESNDLEDLPNIDLQEISVDIVPFWGDKNNFEIGITRQDFRIRAQLNNTFVIFGSVYTDGSDSMWGENESALIGSRKVNELYFARSEDNPEKTMAISTKRSGEIKEKIYYYPNTLSDSDIFNADPENDMQLLDPSEYTIYKRDGDFVMIINCNRRKVITNEFGDEKVVDNDNTNGVFTQFVGFITIEIDNETLSLDFTQDIGTNLTLNPLRYKLKIPQKAYFGYSFDVNENANTKNWRKQYEIFEASKYYTVAKFHGTTYNKDNNDDGTIYSKYGKINGDKFNTLEIDQNTFENVYNVGIIQTNSTNSYVANENYDMPHNAENGAGERYFLANWMNFSIHLPQIGYVAGNQGGLDNIENFRSNTNFSTNFWFDHFYVDNTQPIAAGDVNTKFFARSDLHFTTFLNVPKTLLKKMYQEIGNKKGFKLGELSQELQDEVRNNNYFINGEKNINVPYDYDNTERLGGAGKLNANVSGDVDEEYYFFRGAGNSDCLKFLNELGLLD